MTSLGARDAASSHNFCNRKCAVKPKLVTSWDRSHFDVRSKLYISLTFAIAVRWAWSNCVVSNANKRPLELLMVELSLFCNQPYLRNVDE